MLFHFKNLVFCVERDLLNNVIKFTENNHCEKKYCAISCKKMSTRYISSIILNSVIDYSCCLSVNKIVAMNSVFLYFLSFLK